HHRSVIMEYYVQSRDELTKRKVDPLGLVYYTDHWNLIAYDHLREDIRNYRLDSIRSMFVLSERFTAPDGFDLEEHLKERGASPKNECIRIRFTPQVYRWARRSIPAEIEEEREREDAVDVIFYFENLEYVARWILRFGVQAQVLEPEALRELVFKEATTLARQHAPEAVLEK
ncbi:MAG TPA: WYL domain-containing protein, partial [Rhodothermales bacterium]|nr:WYL domain-containing protein [Rhodothermales bacterium]